MPGEYAWRSTGSCLGIWGVYLCLRAAQYLPQESFETADLRTLTDDEIKPHSQHPLPGLSRVLALPAPAQPRAQLPSPAVPAVPGATPDQVYLCHASDMLLSHIRRTVMACPIELPCLVSTVLS